MPSITQKLDELILAAGGQPSGNGLPIDKKVEQASAALNDIRTDYLDSINAYSPICHSNIFKEDEDYVYIDNLLLPRDSLIYFFWSQTDFVENDSLALRLACSIPNKYFGKHNLFKIAVLEEQDRTIDLSDWNGKYLNSSYLNYQSSVLRTGMSPSVVDVGKYALFRYGLELDVDGQKKYVLSSQITMKNVDGSLEVTEHHFNDYDDVVTEGFYTNWAFNQCIYNPNGSYPIPVDFHEIKISNIESNKGSTVTATGWQVKIPKSVITNPIGKIFPVFCTHKGYIVGDFVQLAQTEGE